MTIWSASRVAVHVVQTGRIGELEGDSEARDRYNSGPENKAGGRPSDIGEAGLVSCAGSNSKSKGIGLGERLDRKVFNLLLPFLKRPIRFKNEWRPGDLSFLLGSRKLCFIARVRETRRLGTGGLSMDS